MFFLVVRGDRLEVAAWSGVATSHAAALELAVDSAHWTLPDGAELLVAVLDHPARRDGLRQTIGRDIFGQRDASGSFELHVNEAHPRAATSVLFDPATTASVRARVPFASPDQAYIRRGPTAVLVTNDLRLAAARQPPPLDPHGVYALLQYGAIPAPFTLFRGVERLPPGHEAWLDSTSSTGLRPRTPAPGTAASGDLEASLLARIDSVLLRARGPSAVLFSGGVDSGLLAARVAAAGLRDVPLLNYAFGPDDPESAHAARMASHLGMPFERIEHSPEAAIDVLRSATRDYSYPFGDCSTLAMNLLVRGSRAWLPPGSKVLDGTGADGAFALGFSVEAKIRSRYEPLSSLPSWIGAFAGRVHAWTGLTATDGRIATAVRLVHRATMMPPLVAAVIAQNSLHGECFRAAGGVRGEVNQAVMQMVASLEPSTSVADRATTLDVIHVCGGIFAAKDFDPLRQRGVTALYPFLDPEVLGPSLELPWSTRCAGAERKGLLKQALARHVPADLVFRRKSNFRPPVLQRFFTEPDTRDFVHRHVLRRDSPLAEFLHRDRVERLFARAFRADRLHEHAYNLLWVLAFAGGWIDGLAELHAPVRSEACVADNAVVRGL